MSRRVAKKVERFYLGTIATVFTLMIIMGIYIDDITWKASVPVMIVLCIVFIKAIEGWVELFCSDKENRRRRAR